jgi:hypothetical protein
MKVKQLVYLCVLRGALHIRELDGSVKFLRDAAKKFVHFIQVSQLMTTTTTMKNNCEQELKKMERQVTEKNEAIAELR